MKNSNIAPFGILAIVIVLLFGLDSCDSNPSQDIVFKAERLFHKAQKQMDAALIKPDLATDSDIENIKTEFQAVSDYCFDNVIHISKDSLPEQFEQLQSIAFLANNQLVRYYFEVRDYQSAIGSLTKFTTIFEPEGIPYLNCQLNLAEAYQYQGDLEQALSIHGKIMDAFYPPVSNENEILTRVLNLPLQTVNIFIMLGDETAAGEAAETAENYYNRIIADWPNSDLENAAYGNLARLFYELENWTSSINSLYQLHDSTGEVSFEAEMMIARITLDGMKDYDEALRLYERLLQRTTDTNIIPSIMLRQGIAHISNKDYDRGRRLLTRISDEFSNFFRNNALPQKYIALAFDKLGDWVRAENEYKWLIDNYPTTEESFDAYLTIAAHYESTNNNDLAASWYRRAEEFYKVMANRYKGSGIESSALSYLAETARRQEQWQKAADYLESIFIKAPQSDAGRSSIVTASSIYKEKLNNPEKADSLINRLKAELISVDRGKNINVMTDDN